MNQLQIQFFWPLTEQIPLDLNYEDCERPKVTYPLPTDGNTFYTGLYTGSTFVASNLTLDVDTTTIKMKEQPSFCRRTILKCLGLKWELK
jgi:hypothetical protein